MPNLVGRSQRRVVGAGVLLSTGAGSISRKAKALSQFGTWRNDAATTMLASMNFFRAAVLCFVTGLSLVSSGFGAVPFRLFEISVSRFSRASEGRAKLELGMLNAKGELRVVETFDIGMPPQTKDEAFDKLLVSSEAWFAFGSLGAQAVANFERVNNGLPLVVAGIPYYEVAPHPAARLNVGNVVNLSTRGIVGTGTTPTLIGGFVIEGQTRRVLVRAIGPSLAAFGVTDPVADPHLSLHHNTTTIHSNGNWGASADSDAIAAASVQAGAFPLDRPSKDAALLVELPPGNYTASVVSESIPSTGGTALLEIYILP